MQDLLFEALRCRSASSDRAFQPKGAQEVGRCKPERLGRVDGIDWDALVRDHYGPLSVLSLGAAPIPRGMGSLSAHSPALLVFAEASASKNAFAIGLGIFLTNCR